MCFGDAFDQYSLAEIERRTAPEQRLEINAADALRLACNAVRIGSTMIMNDASAELRGDLESWG